MRGARASILLAGVPSADASLPEDIDYLRELGAAEIFDRNADLQTTIRERHRDGVDAILDVVSFTPQDALLTEGGRLASPLGAAGEGPGRFNLMAQPTPREPSTPRRTPRRRNPPHRIQNSYELAHAGEALAAFQSTHTQGKLSITIS